MKKYILLTTALLLVNLGAAVTGVTPANAASTATTLNVTADINAVLTLTVNVKELDTNGIPIGPDLGTNMNFGSLIKDGNNAQWGSRSFGVFLTSSTSARPYTITSTMASPTNGTNTLPNATLLKVISATKQGADISGDSFNPNAQSAVTNNTIIYTSSPAGDGALVNLVYGISGANPDGSAPFPGWVGIPSDFPGGEYSSTASYSLVLL